MTDVDDIPSEGAVLGLDWEGVPADAWYDPDGVPVRDDDGTAGPAKIGCCSGNSDPLEPWKVDANPVNGAPVRLDGEMN